jgi:hypothetical protein
MIMTEYKHRLTVVCPGSLISAANQLAQIVGESAADVNTFKDASWQDAQGNLYAVCSFASKSVVIDTLSTGLPSELPAHAEGVDTDLAQQAFGNIDVYSEGYALTSGKIVICIDEDPKGFLSDIGLTVNDLESQL